MSEIHTEVTGKELQSSSDRMIGEGYDLNNPNNIPGFKQTTNFKPKYAAAQDKKKKGTIAKFFSNMARLGMTYDDKVIDNMRAIPADKNFIPKENQLVNQDLFAQLSSQWKQKSNADKNFFEKDYPQKREALRKLALQPELEDILDTMTNEAIVYDSDYTYFAEPFIEAQEMKDFKKDVREYTDLVLVRGKWVSSALSNQLSDTYHAILTVSDQINDFDNSLSEDSELGIKLKNLLIRSDRDKESARYIRTQLGDVNEKAITILTMGSQQLVAFARELKNLIEDKEKTKPQLLINWKELEHYSEKPIRDMGVNIYKMLYQFITLMQIFLKH